MSAIPARYAVERHDWKAAADLAIPGNAALWAKFPFTEDGKLFTKLIVPSSPADSAVIKRMNTGTSSRFMPALAVETVDPAGQAALTAWINSL